MKLKHPEFIECFCLRGKVLSVPCADDCARSELKGQTECIPCSLGRFANRYAMTSCVQCGPADQTEKLGWSDLWTVRKCTLQIFAMGATFISARCSCLCGVLLRQAAGNHQLILIRDSGAGQPARLWCHSASRHGFKFRPWRSWLSSQTIGDKKHIGSMWVHVILIWIDI